MTELARIAASLLIVLVVIAAVASHPRRNVFTSLEDLGLAVLPSLAAILFTYLIASTFLERRNISPQQRLISKIVDEVTASVKPVKGIKMLHSLIMQTPYGDAFLNATEVHMVGRWYNETLTHYPDELRRFFEGGGKLDLVLMDWTNDDTVTVAARQFAGRGEIARSYLDEISAVTYKASSTITALRRATGAAKIRFEDAVSVYIYPETMNYWGMRFRSSEMDELYFAPYDNFRGQTLASPTVVFDLNLSLPTHEFWEAEFTSFIAASVPFDIWTVRQICDDLHRAVESQVPLAEPLRLDLIWPYAEVALGQQDFELATSEMVDHTGARNMIWRHTTGGELQVLVSTEHRIMRASWTPAEPVGSEPDRRSV